MAQGHQRARARSIRQRVTDDGDLAAAHLSSTQQPAAVVDAHAVESAALVVVGLLKRIVGGLDAVRVRAAHAAGAAEQDVDARHLGGVEQGCAGLDQHGLVGFGEVHLYEVHASLVTVARPRIKLGLARACLNPEHRPTMQLAFLDWAIIGGYFALALGIGLYFKARAGSSFVEYFVSGRSLPWWIAGTSMVATTFAADTPLAVTGLVAKHGLAGNWFWWAWAFGGMLTVFVFARLWRRAEVLTDVELIELRYSGRAAAFLRGFRGFYIAVVMNSIVIGWVTKAMAQVLQQTVLYDPAATAGASDGAGLALIAVMLVVTGAYSVLSGLWGVAITDMIQFVLAMGGCIGLAVVAVSHLGGVDEMQAQLNKAFEGEGDPLAFLPDFSEDGAAIPLGIFLVLVLSQWWATWYPGAEPGGGGYIVQRMASCKDEGHAVKATLFFQLAHYCLRPWPWILVAFVAIALHPELRAEGADAGAGYPMMIRELAPTGLHLVRGLSISGLVRTRRVRKRRGDMLTFCTSKRTEEHGLAGRRRASRIR